MGSGKGRGFSSEQLAWLKERLPEYMAKTAYGENYSPSPAIAPR